MLLKDLDIAGFETFVKVYVFQARLILVIFPRIITLILDCHFISFSMSFSIRIQRAGTTLVGTT